MLFFLATFAFLLFVWLIIVRRKHVIAANPKWKCKELTKEFSVADKPLKAMLFYPIFLVERVLFAFILVFLRDEPVLQCLLCFLLFIPVSCCFTS